VALIGLATLTLILLLIVALSSKTRVKAASIGIWIAHIGTEVYLV